MSKSVKFNVVDAHAHSDLEEYYRVEVWSRDLGPYASLFTDEPAWRGYGLHSSSIEELADQVAAAWELYGKVRVRRTVNEVIQLDRPSDLG